MNLGLFYSDLRIRVKFYPDLIFALFWKLEFTSLMGHSYNRMQKMLKYQHQIQKARGGKCLPFTPLSLPPGMPMERQDYLDHEQL
jgi:hypothetical protein